MSPGADAVGRAAAGADPEHRPLSVLLVLGTSTGGVGQHVRALAAGLVAAGDRVQVAGPASTEAAFGFTGVGASFEAVEVAATPRPRRDLVAAQRLGALAEGQDVVHAHGLRAGSLAVLAVRTRWRTAPRRQPHDDGGRRRVRLVVTWHNALLQRGGRAVLLSGLERLVARGADVTLGASSDLVDRARRLGARDARLAPVAAPDLPPPARHRHEVRAELVAAAGLGEVGARGGPSDHAASDLPTPLVLLAVGRLAEQKDYPTLLTALADHWPEGVERPLLVIAGEGPLRPMLEGTARERGLPVLLLGQRSDVPDLLAAADVYVLSSRWEARALVLQEAARAGLPIVATWVGGVPELVADAAVLVPPGDPVALADALVRLVSDRAERRRLGDVARARSTSWPDEAETTRQVRACYIGLLSSTG